MGAGAAKEIMPVVPVVMNALPALIQGFQSTKSSSTSQEDKKIAEVLERLQRDRNDIDRVLANQAQLSRTCEAITMLVNRLDGGGLEQLTNGATGCSNGTAKIRIEMDLPDNPAERDEAVREFWRSLGRIANAYEQQEQRIMLANEPQDRTLCRRENLAIEGSACAPVDDDDKSDLNSPSGPLDRILSCEICTLPYNSEERRPTLLSKCGHTFCKDCLTKSMRRNRRCPTCREHSDVDVDKLPTNFSILDFINKAGDDDDGNCKGRMLSMEDECNLSYEDQLERAKQMSLEESQRQQSEADFLYAQRLQEEEDRLMRFRQHEDLSEKARRMEGEDSDDSDNRRGRMFGGGRFPRQNSRKGKDNKRFSDNESDDDCCHEPSKDNLYANARQKLMEDSDEYDTDGACGKSRLEVARNDYLSDERGRNDPENYRPFRRNEDQTHLEDAEECSLFEFEKDCMMERAEVTYEEDKYKRKKMRKLKEQEELDLALALSMSMMNTQDICVAAD